MKFALILALLLSTLEAVDAQDVHALIKQAEKQESIPNEKAAFNTFKVVLKYDPTNLHALTKCSELCSRIGARQTDTQVRDSYYQAAIMYARNALKQHPGSDEAHVAMGIAIGRTSLVKNGKEKIAAAKEIKHYAETALKINPRNFKAWHIIGKWNYEVSNLNLVERAATKVFYGGLPDASLKNSIMAYEKARSLNGSFLLNYLELSKAYKRNGDKQKALSLLKTLMGLTVQTEDDPRIKSEATALLKEWSR